MESIHCTRKIRVLDIVVQLIAPPSTNAIDTPAIPTRGQLHAPTDCLSQDMSAKPVLVKKRGAKLARKTNLSLPTITEVRALSILNLATTVVPQRVAETLAAHGIGP